MSGAAPEYKFDTPAADAAGTGPNYESSTYYTKTQPQPTTIIYTSSQLGHGPTATHCHKCNLDVTTTVTHESGLCSWLGCAGFCLFGCWCGCCLIPFVADSFKDTEHKCPNCGSHLGDRSRI